MDCLGCRIANGIEPNLNIVYENEWVTAVLDIAPFNEGHTLILPKRHVWDVEDLQPTEAQAIMEASQRLSAAIKRAYRPDGITVCQNGGVFNDLTHYHMHLIPRYRGDGFAWSEPLEAHGAETRLAETKRKLSEALQGA